VDPFDEIGPIDLFDKASSDQLVLGNCRETPLKLAEITFQGGKQDQGIRKRVGPMIENVLTIESKRKDDAFLLTLGKISIERLRRKREKTMIG
jgi:hypothetical protein